MKLDEKDLVVWGAGGHAKVVADIVRSRGIRLAGFIDDINPERRGGTFCGGKLLGTRSALADIYRAGARQAFVAIGDNCARLEAAQVLSECGFKFVPAIHPSAVCPRHDMVGPGSLVAAGAMLGPDADVGWHVIINTGASLDHDCVARDGSHVGPGAVIASSSEIGRGAWIGAGAVVVNQSRVGAFAVVGAGAVVVKDIPGGVVAVGVPAIVLHEAERETVAS